MQVACPHCRQVLEFADRRPAFCGFCGGSLTKVDVHEAATQACVELNHPESPTQLYGLDDAGSGGIFASLAGKPQTVGEFTLVRQIGHGGMGVVYEAEQAATGRRVALKLLSPRLAHTDESMERFLREGRLAAAFSHPRSTFVFGAGDHAGQPFITMELMPGRTLNDVSRDEGPLPSPRAVDYILDAIEGLEAAHAAGIIHRDVKPSNCFLDSDGRVKIGDFGLSKSLVSDAALTRTGAFLGTPLFAAPEQVRAGEIDRRTDIYSVGATLFYLIAGRGPFTGDPAAVIAQIASDPAPPLRSLVPDIPNDLDRIVARTLEKDPARRFTDLAQLRLALQPFATGGIVAAPVGRRAGAYFFDMMLTGVGFGVLVGSLTFAAVFAKIFDANTAGPTGDFSRSSHFPTSPLVTSWFVFASLVVFVSYFAICEAWTGMSLGKRLLGLRVVGLDGGRPGIRRAFVRATLVPGLMWLSAAALITSQLTSNLGELGSNPHRELIQQLLSHLAVVPTLVFLVTMRARNGYAGLHDLASGTRVVEIRHASRSSRSSDVPVVVPRVMNRPAGAYGPFRVMGSLGTSPDGAVLQARDEALNRLVWVFVRPGRAPSVSAARTRVARATRPRWLQGGETDSSRWDAFEAVLGAPLRQAVSQPGHRGWERGRFLLLDLAEELAAAAADGTLPTSLTLDQVWLDRDGRLKLLDTAIESLGGGGRPVSSTVSSVTVSPVALIRAALQLFSSGQILPVHAQDFLVELTRRPDENETLVWAVAQLREFSTRTASLTWSDRLVAVGVSTGTEYSFYDMLICIMLLALLMLTGITEPVRLAAIFIFALALPVAVGFATHGGPVFRLVGIRVRRSSGEPAGRLRCAWRNFVAWTLVILAYTFSLAVLPGLMKTMEARLPTATADGAESGAWQVMVIVLTGMAPALALLMHAAGACYAIVRPQRGIQDLLAGTRLVPR